LFELIGCDRSPAKETKKKIIKFYMWINPISISLANAHFFECIYVGIRMKCNEIIMIMWSRVEQKSIFFPSSMSLLSYERAAQWNWNSMLSINKHHCWTFTAPLTSLQSHSRKHLKIMLTARIKSESWEMLQHQLNTDWKLFTFNCDIVIVEFAHDASRLDKSIAE
jgi:hypothetical protein